jgi:hypothetical protein
MIFANLPFCARARLQTFSPRRQRTPTGWNSEAETADSASGSSRGTDETGIEQQPAGTLASFKIGA